MKDTRTPAGLVKQNARGWDLGVVVSAVVNLWSAGPPLGWGLLDHCGHEEGHLKPPVLVP